MLRESPDKSPLELNNRPIQIAWLTRLLHYATAALLSVLALVSKANDTGEKAVSKTFRAEKLAALDAEVGQAIRESQILGASLWIEHRGVAYHKAYGQRALTPAPEPMTEDTVFDVASITKVVATATAAMWCVERGLISLDAPLCTYLPTFTGEGREKITIRHLLLHTSGLKTNLNSTVNKWSTRDEAIALARSEKPTFEPGTAYSYSSIGTMLLGAAIEQVTGRALDEFCTQEIFRPLKMKDTLFRPGGDVLLRVAPTSAPQRGLVDDQMARMMGGVAGHASLFTTTADLARFARMMLNQGELEGARVLQAETIRLMTGVQSPPGLRSPGANDLPVRHGLGWDIDTPYRTPPHEYGLHRGALFPVGSYGHAGWTGQSLWIDPFSQTFVIFLCNRYQPGAPVAPDASYHIHYRVATLTAEAIEDFDFTNVPGALPRAGQARP